jgi:DNA-binding MarR family transcriptional regulator
LKGGAGLTLDMPASPRLQTTISDGVLINLRRIIQAIDLHSRQLARQHGITTPQLLILKQLQSESTVTVSQLAKQVSLKQATVTDILNRLERKGLVRRRKYSTDRRQVWIEETDAGRKLLEAAPSPLQETFLDKFEDQEIWKQTMILSSLQLLSSLMVEEDIASAPILSTGVLTDTIDSKPVKKEDKKKDEIFGKQTMK